MGFLSSLFGGLGQALSGAGGSLMGGLSSLGSGIMNMFGGGSGGGGGAAASGLGNMLGGGGSKSPAASPATSGKGNMMSSLFPGGADKGVAGLMSPLLGNMFAPKSPKIPDFNSLGSVQALQNFKPGQSVSPEYQKMIQNNVGQLRDRKVKELQALYHNARPGTDYLTDTNYQSDLSRIDQDVQNNMTDELASAEKTFSSQEQQRLTELAQMDIFHIMQQTGMEANEANQFKEMFSNVGNMFLTNATRKPDPMDSYFEELTNMMRAKQSAAARGTP